MLEQLFGSRTRVKLLRLFLANPDKIYYVREITRKVEERINSVRRELKNLEEMGLIFFEYKNQKKYYRVNDSFILYPELKSLILKAQVIMEKRIVSDLESLGNIQYMILTGFFVGIKDHLTDLLIVGKVNKRKIQRMIKKFEKTFNNEINYTIMTTKEFKYRKDLTDRFLYDILENKKIVMIDKLNKSPKSNLSKTK